MSQFLIIFLWCLPGILKAESVPLETIEVAAKKEDFLFDYTNQSIIKGNELNSGSPNLLTSKLLGEVGLILSQNGGPGGRTSYFLRGTESRHVAFTLDGLKLNDPSNTDRQFDGAFFTTPFLRTAVVHKGPQSVLYGSDALGGLVEMQTRKGEHAPETRINVNGGSFGTIESSISNDWRNQKNQGTMTAQRFHSDGISRLNKKRFNAKERDATDITNLTSSSRHQWNSQIESQLLLSFLEGKNELDGSNNDNAHDKSLNKHLIVQQKTNFIHRENQAFSLRNGLSRHERELDTLALGKEIYEGDLIQNEFLYRLNFKRLNLLSGLSTEHEEFEVPSVRRNFDLHGLFTQFAFDFSDFKFHVGQRAEKHVRYGSFQTGSAGLQFEKNNTRLSLQYSQGFKAPSLYQLYAPPLSGSTIGNSHLIPELNHSWDASLRNFSKEHEASLSFFQNRLSNLIVFNSNQGYINQGYFIAEGIEIGGKILRPYHQIRLSMTHQQFKNEETVVLRRPYNSLIGALAFFPAENWELSGIGKWFSSRKDLDYSGEAVKLNSYETFELGSRYTTGKWDFGLQILNIFNRYYEDLFGFSVLPRSYFFHVGYTF